MVGNRPAGGVPVVVPPVGIVTGGSVPVAAGAVVVGVGEGLGLAATTTEPDAANERAPLPLALAVRSPCPPPVAVLATSEPAWSSSAWPAGRLPSEHVSPLVFGQTV